MKNTGHAKAHSQRLQLKLRERKPQALADNAHHPKTNSTSTKNQKSPRKETGTQVKSPEVSRKLLGAQCNLLDIPVELARIYAQLDDCKDR